MANAGIAIVSALRLSARLAALVIGWALWIGRKDRRKIANE